MFVCQNCDMRNGARISANDLFLITSSYERGWQFNDSVMIFDDYDFFSKMKLISYTQVSNYYEIIGDAK